MYNRVEMCNYGNSKNRIIRDILFNGCASDKARDSIIRKGDQITLTQVLEILQTENAISNTHQTFKEINPIASVHYALYENNKKFRKKAPSIEQNTDSTDSTNSKRLFYRCGEPYSKEHEPVCRAQNAFCNACGKKCHFMNVCKSTGRQEKPNCAYRKTVHTVQATPSDGYYNETGDWVPAIPSFRSSNIASVNTLSVVSDPSVIQDIHPGTDPELTFMLGMTQSQIFFQRNQADISSFK